MAITNRISLLRKEPYPRNILLILLEGSPTSLDIPVEQILEQEEWLKQAIVMLPEYEQRVLQLRFEKQETLVETGACLGIKKERVRQIELQDLRHLYQAYRRK